MTQAHERSATLSQMVAEEIRALMARRRMSGRQLATALKVSPSWVSYRLTGAQPIDVNDLSRIAHALGVGVHELLPPPELAAEASVSVWNPSVTIWPGITPSAHRQRPPGRKDSRRPNGGMRTARLPRPGLPEAS